MTREAARIIARMSMPEVELLLAHCRGGEDPDLIAAAFRRADELGREQATARRESAHTPYAGITEAIRQRRVA